MRAYEQKCQRQHHVLLRMAVLYSLIEENPCSTMREYRGMSAIPKQVPSDLQRLWEDGRVVRYKAQDVAREFGINANSWFWITVEEADRWREEDEAFARRRADAQKESSQEAG